MHVLTATRSTQGERADDFCFTVEGELVRLPAGECSRPDDCGCGRSFAGLSSHRATTTAMIRNRPELTLVSVIELFHQDSLDQGYRDDAKTRRASELEAAFMVDVAEDFAHEFGDGTVVFRRGDAILGPPIAC